MHLLSDNETLEILESSKNDQILLFPLTSEPSPIYLEEL